MIRKQKKETFGLDLSRQAKSLSSWEVHGVPGNPDGCLVPVIFKTTSCKNMGCCIFTKQQWNTEKFCQIFQSCCHVAFPAWCPVKQISYLYGTKCNKTQLFFLICTFVLSLFWKYFRGADYMCDTLQNKGFYDELCDVSACLLLTINYFVELSFVTLAKDIFLGSNNEDPEEIFFPSEILLVVTLLVDKSLRGALDSCSEGRNLEKNNNASTLNAKLPSGDVWTTLYYCYI